MKVSGTPEQLVHPGCEASINSVNQDQKKEHNVIAVSLSFHAFEFKELFEPPTTAAGQFRLLSL